MKLSARSLLATLLLACGFAAFPAAAQTVVTLSNQYTVPQFVAVNADKTIFVTDTTYALSALFLVNGAYTTPPTAFDTNFDGLFNSPQGVAVDTGGDIFSTTNLSASAIGLWEFRPPDYSNILAVSTSNGGGVAHGVAVDSHGNFFVANSNAAVYELPAPSYGFASLIGTGQSGVDHPVGIAFDSQDNLFVADQRSGSGVILELTAASGYSTVKTITAGNLTQPAGVAVDSRGNLYVTDSAANTLTEILAPDYTTAAVIDSTHFSAPLGVALDADDNIFVVDTGNHALKEILALPAVTALAPAAGPLAGGNPVTIAGVHLTGATAVSFGANAATNVTVVSDTQVTATAPAGSAGTVDVRVTTPNGPSIVAPSDRYVYGSAPAVSGVSPSSGAAAGGYSVSIAGSNLGGASAVFFGVTAATSFQVLGNTLIGAVAPAGSAGTTVDVTVTTPDGTSATGASDQFTYVAVPVVTGVAPASGPQAGGVSVAVTGSNFTGATAVTFGVASASFTINSATSITATAPPGSGAVDVTVTTAGGTSVTSAADSFTYVAPIATQTLLSAAPNPSAPGQSVTFTAAVTSQSGVPTGSVTFLDGLSTLGAGNLNAGVASFTTAALTTGAHTITAAYAGALGFTASTSIAVTQNVIAPAPGGSTRTWVSSLGDDANLCARTAPCLTFRGALAMTAAGGEISVVDPGDYGNVLINKAVTISGEDVGTVGALVSVGTGVEIAAGATDVVTLRGLEFDGGGAAGGSAAGVLFTSGGGLLIDQCSIVNFQGADAAGINFQPSNPAKLWIGDSLVSNNGSTVPGSGLSGNIIIQPQAGGSVKALIERVQALGATGAGVRADGSVPGAGATTVVVRDTTIVASSGDGLAAVSAGPAVSIMADGVTAQYNGGYGVRALGTGAAVRLGRSTVTNNNTGLGGASGGVLASFANNSVANNLPGGDGAPTTTAALK